jgi:hypothetical protein
MERPVAKQKSPKRTDETFPSLPVYWRRALAVSLSDLEAELSISLHHPLQPERALEALSYHSSLLKGLINQEQFPTVPLRYIPL